MEGETSGGATTNYFLKTSSLHVSTSRPGNRTPRCPMLDPEHWWRIFVVGASGVFGTGGPRFRVVPLQRFTVSKGNQFTLRVGCGPGSVTGP